MKKWVLMVLLLGMEYMYRQVDTSHTPPTLFLSLPFENQMIQIQSYEKGYTLPCIRYVDMQGKSHVICDKLYQVIVQK